jgi:hypothetical protein
MTFRADHLRVVGRIRSAVPQWNDMVTLGCGTNNASRFAQGTQRVVSDHAFTLTLQP